MTLSFKSLFLAAALLLAAAPASADTSTFTFSGTADTGSPWEVTLVTNLSALNTWAYGGVVNGDYRTSGFGIVSYRLGRITNNDFGTCEMAIVGLADGPNGDTITFWGTECTGPFSRLYVSLRSARGAEVLFGNTQPALIDHADWPSAISSFGGSLDSIVATTTKPEDCQ